MNALDLILVVVIVSFAVAGVRQGFLVSVVSFLGFGLGGLLGLLVVPHLLGSQSPSRGRALLALGGVLVLATLVQTLAAWLASILRRRLLWQPARRLDAAAGGLVGIVAVLGVIWLLGSVLLRADSSVPFASDARDSTVLSVVDDVMPGSPDRVFSAFGDLLDTTGFPKVFSDLTQERPAPVAAPDATVSRFPGVRLAAASTVKIIGTAGSCNRRIEGSGFVFAPQRVMTNAHVLAGVTDPRVYIGGLGRGYAAHVVAFDPKTDVAVLWVPGLRSWCQIRRSPIRTAMESRTIGSSRTVRVGSRGRATARSSWRRERHRANCPPICRTHPGWHWRRHSAPESTAGGSGSRYVIGDPRTTRRCSPESSPISVRYSSDRVRGGSGSASRSGRTRAVFCTTCLCGASVCSASSCHGRCESPWTPAAETNAEASARRRARENPLESGFPGSRHARARRERSVVRASRNSTTAY